MVDESCPTKVFFSILLLNLITHFYLWVTNDESLVITHQPHRRFFQGASWPWSTSWMAIKMLRRSGATHQNATEVLKQTQNCENLPESKTPLVIVHTITKTPTPFNHRRTSVERSGSKQTNSRDPNNKILIDCAIAISPTICFLDTIDSRSPEFDEHTRRIENHGGQIGQGGRVSKLPCCPAGSG